MPSTELENQVVETGTLAARACRLAGLPAERIRELLTEGLMEDAPPEVRDDQSVKAVLNIMAACLQRLDLQQERINELEASNG